MLGWLLGPRWAWFAAGAAAMWWYENKIKEAPPKFSSAALAGTDRYVCQESPKGRLCYDKKLKRYVSTNYCDSYHELEAAF
ncbi:MAG: hypothetical protein R3322_00090 [Kiloniellales bacterium]|nr:hypothetical protein [Kiloniellales bacterium]